MLNIQKRTYKKEIPPKTICFEGVLQFSSVISFLRGFP